MLESRLGVADAFLPMGPNRVIPVRLWGSWSRAGEPAEPGPLAPLLPPALAREAALRFALDPTRLAAARLPAHTVTRRQLCLNPGTVRPAVLVSPGRGDPSWTNAGLCAALARAGALVAEIAHPGDSPALSEEGHPIPVPDDLREPARLTGLRETRAADLSAVLTALSPGGAWARLGADPDNLSAVGHSLGGAASVSAAADGLPLSAVVVLDGRLDHDTALAGMPCPVLLLTAEREEAFGWKELGEHSATRGAWLTARGAEHYTFTELATRAAELGVIEWPRSRRETWLGTGPAVQRRSESIALILGFLGLGSDCFRDPPSGWRERWRRA